MIFLIPFFFLLDDSVLGSGLSDLSDALSELVAFAGVATGAVLELAAGAALGLAAAPPAPAAAAVGATDLPLATAAASASEAVDVSSLLSSVGLAGLLPDGSRSGAATEPPEPAAPAAAPPPTFSPAELDSVPAGPASEFIGAGKLPSFDEAGAATVVPG